MRASMAPGPSADTALESWGGPRWAWLRESALGGVVAFFALASLLAWSLWVILGVLARSAGMETGEFVAQVEAGNWSVASQSIPGWGLYLMTRGIDFSLSIAGLIMIGVTQGRSGYRQLGRRLVKWRFGAFWYLLALAPILAYTIAAAFASTLERGALHLDSTTMGTILFSLSSGLFVSLFLRGAMGEEIGLRGFALPRLQERMTPARASLIVGLGWAVWHLPVLLEAELSSALFFLAFVIGSSFTFTWMFNGSGGSLIPPVLFHATQNWEEGFETVLPGLVESDWETIAVIGVLVLSIVAVVAVVRGGRSSSHAH